MLLLLYLFKLLPQYDVVYAREYHAAIVAFLPRLIFNKKLIFEVNGLANEEQRMKGHNAPALRTREIEEKLQTPFGSKNLSELAKSKHKCAIIFDGTVFVSVMKFDVITIFPDAAIP
jgi:hypothetical protein